MRKSAQLSTYSLIAGEEQEKIEHLVNMVNILTSVKADSDTIHSAMVYQLVQDGSIAEADLQQLQLNEHVETIVEDTLWLNSLPAAIQDYDDDNAKLLREYVMEASHDPRAVSYSL